MSAWRETPAKLTRTLIERRKMLKITGKSAPLHLFVKLVRQQKSKTCHACEREKEKKSTWSEVHIISKRPVTTTLYGVAIGKKKEKKKLRKFCFFFPSIGIAAFFLTSTGAKN